MASRLIVPFDYNPQSTSVKVASYTVPAGKYARVLAECDSGGTITIDAVTAVTTAAFGSIDAYAASGPNNTTGYTCPANNRAIVNVNVGTTAANQLNIAANAQAGFDGGGTSSPPARVELGPSQAIAKVNNGNAVSYTGVTIPSNATARQAEFWLKAGQILNGTANWRAIVTEYNVIS